VEERAAVIVCVTGSRHYTGPLIPTVLNQIHASCPITWVAQGGQRGADYFAKLWAQVNGITSRSYRPRWETFGLSAGPIRNRAMLDHAKPDVVLAFPIGESRGTWDCVQAAIDRGITVEVFE
jgi:hypothetical protein